MSLERDARYTRLDFRAAGMADEEIDALLAVHGGDGFQSVTIPKATNEIGGTLPIARRSLVPLKRWMSQRALKNTLPGAVKGERRFFRTWVRAERRQKAQTDK